MTVVAVLVDPPRPGLVLPRLVATSLLSPGEAADLYAAAVRDTLVAAAASGGDLLVNYRAEEDLPPEHRDGDADAEAQVRALARAALDDPDDARFEVQVGSTFAARAGNTATHLLREEGADSVAVLPGTAPFLFRTHLDSAAMKLRSSEAVLGPAPGGRVYFLGLTEPIDFEGAYEPPEVQTLTRRARREDFGVDFLPMLPIVEDGNGLADAVSLLSARRAAGRRIPAFTAETFDRLDLRVEVVDGERRVVSAD